MKCYLTNEEIKDLAVYIRVNSKKQNISSKELRYRILKYNLGEDKTSKPFLLEYYKNQFYSLPDFLKNFGFRYQDTLFLLEYYNIPIRGIKEATNTTRTRKKYKTTCYEKYGFDNISKVENIKDKKSKTFIENYGVDNIFKTKEFKRDLDKFYNKKYGMSLRDKKSIDSINAWKNKTEEERSIWLDNSIHSEKSLLRLGQKGYVSSSIEYVILNVFNSLDIECVHQLLIRIDNRHRYFYDFFLPEYNLIIEYNGTYWHGDPAKYKKNDLIHYKFGDITASDIWEKDKKKIDHAKTVGYNVEVWWERDFIKKSVKQQLSIIIKRLKKYDKKYRNKKYNKSV